MDDFLKVKRNIKLVVIVAVVVIGYVIFAIYTRDYAITTNKYLLVGDYIMWHESRGKWYQKTSVDKDVTNHVYTVYNGTTKYEAQTAQFLSSRWHFFDKEYNNIPTDNFKLAYTGVKDLKPINYELEEYDSSDDNIIYNVTKTSSKSMLDLYKSTLSKIILDFDGDGNEEIIYRFTNFKLDIVDYDVKTYIVLVRNGNVLDTVIGSNSDVLALMEVIDIDNDSNGEIIIGKNVVDYPTFDSCYQIYKVENNSLQLYQDCLFEGE